MIFEERMTKEYNIFVNLCSDAREDWLTDILLLTSTCFPILSQDKTLMALTAVWIVIINAHVFTAMVDGFTQVFIWELLREFPY